MLSDEIAYERWVPVGADGTAALEVPLDGPHSYRGEQLKLVWRVAVRAHRRGVDGSRSTW